MGVSVTCIRASAVRPAECHFSNLSLARAFDAEVNAAQQSGK
jgi:hypothetical protein